MTEADFLPGCSPQMANSVLHYVCPVLSVLSFVLFERDISLSKGIWTSLAAIPSCLYWIVYAVLSATGLWEEPYAFAAQEEKGVLRKCLPFFLLPASFIALSFVLWIVK